MSLENRWFKELSGGLLSLLTFILLLVITCSHVRGGEKDAFPSQASVIALEGGRSLTEIGNPAEGDNPAKKGNLEEDGQGESLQGKSQEALRFFVNEQELSVDWEENTSLDALRNLVSKGPLTIQMSMYGGFEQVGPIGQELPREDQEITTSAGDIVLYSGNQMVVFYGSNTWAYTRLGRVRDKTREEMKELLGTGDVTITLSIQAPQDPPQKITIFKKPTSVKVKAQKNEAGKSIALVSWKKSKETRLGLSFSIRSDVSSCSIPPTKDFRRM